MRDMHLDDLEEHDIDNLQYVMKKAKDYNFDTMLQTQAFVKTCLTAILSKCGVTINILTAPDDADRQLSRNNVKVENRKYEGEDHWRSGIYVYKENEIVGFISVPIKTILNTYKIKTTETP